MFHPYLLLKLSSKQVPNFTYQTPVTFSQLLFNYFFPVALSYSYEVMQFSCTSSLQVTPSCTINQSTLYAHLFGFKIDTWYFFLFILLINVFFSQQIISRYLKYENIYLYQLWPTTMFPVLQTNLYVLHSLYTIQDLKHCQPRASIKIF